MLDSFYERFVHSNAPGWYIARTVLIVAPILAGMVFGIALFLDGWRQ
jgi:hypothetical protein